MVRLLVITVGAAGNGAAVASDELWRRGVLAIEERPAGGRIELRAVLGDDELPVAVDELGERFDVHVEEVDDRPGEQWRDHARPVVISDRLVVVPAWWEGERAIGTACVIEPGSAFGLGDHPTTQATLALLDETLRGHAAVRVLDVGCGTGVLGIAAVLLGAASVRAIDVSGAAIDATRDNAERNRVADRLVADRSAAGDLDGPYDVIVANLLAPILLDLAADLRRLLAPAGTLIVSGLLDGRSDHVIAALEPLTVNAQRAQDGWVALSLS